MMTKPSFLLTEQPWIPCRMRDGSRVELGARAALTRAHEIVCVDDASPLVTAVLHRFLLAILHRTFGPSGIDAWVALAERGTFEGAAIDRYLSTWEERFDLLHPERPFGQTRGLPPEFEPDPVHVLVTERSNWGGGVSLFEHRPEGHPSSLSLAEAARWLLAFHAFAPGGLVKKPGEPTSATAGPLQRSAVVLVRGATLFETLLANLLVYAPDRAEPIAGLRDDAPPWEQPAPPSRLDASQEPKRVPRGWLDLLTWQSRRLALVVDGDRVTGCVRAVYQGLAPDAPRDPMVAYRADKKLGMLPIAFSESRVFWRDAHALFRATSEEQGLPPRAIVQLGDQDLLGIVDPGKRYDLQLCGLVGDQAAIKLVRTEAVGVTAALLRSADTREVVRTALDAAEDAAAALRSSMRTLAIRVLTLGNRDPDPKDVRGLTDNLGAERRYWAALGGAFDTFLDGLAVGAPGAESAFRDAAMTTARRQLAAAIDAVGTSARALRAGALADSVLRRELATLTAPSQPEVNA